MSRGADRDRCITAGCTDFLAKPVDLDTLVRTAARLCDSQFPVEQRAGALASPRLAPADETAVEHDDPGLRAIADDWLSELPAQVEQRQTAPLSRRPLTRIVAPRARSDCLSSSISPFGWRKRRLPDDSRPLRLLSPNSCNLSSRSRNSVRSDRNTRPPSSAVVQDGSSAPILNAPAGTRPAMARQQLLVPWVATSVRCLDAMAMRNRATAAAACFFRSSSLRPHRLRAASTTGSLTVEMPQMDL